MAQYADLVSAAMGFAPAILLMLLTLQPYTYPKVEKPYFGDPKLFGMFAFGIVLGVFLYVASLPFGFLFFILSFLLVESLKLVILNLPRFQLKVDTPFYAFGLGAGMASALAFGTIYFALRQPDIGYDPLILIFVGITSVQIAFLQISTATTIGIGVARGRPWPFFAQAAMMHLVVILLTIPLVQNPDDIASYVLFGVATVFIATYYYYICYRQLPDFIKEALRYSSEKKAKKVRRT